MFKKALSIDENNVATLAKYESFLVEKSRTLFSEDEISIPEAHAAENDKSELKLLKGGATHEDIVVNESKIKMSADVSKGRDLSKAEKTQREFQVDILVWSLPPFPSPSPSPSLP